MGLNKQCVSGIITVTFFPLLLKENIVLDVILLHTEISLYRAIFY